MTPDALAAAVDRACALLIDLSALAEAARGAGADVHTMARLDGAVYHGAAAWSLLRREHARLEPEEAARQAEGAGVARAIWGATALAPCDLCASWVAAGPSAPGEGARCVNCGRRVP